MKPCLSLRSNLCDMKECIEKKYYKELFLTIIEKKRLQLEEYDRLPQSIYHEMFGDSEPTPLLQQEFALKLESIEKQKELIHRSIKEMEEIIA